MSWTVYYTDRFLRDIEQHIDYLRSQAVPDDVIHRWYTRLLDRIDRLEHWPEAHPVDERFSRQVGQDTRKLNHGDYLVCFQLDPSHHRILVLTLIHGARDR